MERPCNNFVPAGAYITIPQLPIIMILMCWRNRSGTLKRAMKRLAEVSGVNWREYLGLAVMAYRLMPHKATGFSPFKMFYVRDATTTTEMSR